MKPNEKWSEKESYGIYTHVTVYIIHIVGREQSWGCAVSRVGRSRSGGRPSPHPRPTPPWWGSPSLCSLYIQIFLSVPWNFSRAQAPESTFKCLRWAWADFQFSANIIFVSHCVKLSNECIFCIHKLCVIVRTVFFYTKSVFCKEVVLYYWEEILSQSLGWGPLGLIFGPGVILDWGVFWTLLSCF